MTLLQLPPEPGTALDALAGDRTGPEHHLRAALRFSQDQGSPPDIFDLNFHSCQRSGVGAIALPACCELA